MRKLDEIIIIIIINERTNKKEPKIPTQRKSQNIKLICRGHYLSRNFKKVVPPIKNHLNNIGNTKEGYVHPISTIVAL
jgi:hypothetical protein